LPVTIENLSGNLKEINYGRIIPGYLNDQYTDDTLSGNILHEFSKVDREKNN